MPLGVALCHEGLWSGLTVGIVAPNPIGDLGDLAVQETVAMLIRVVLNALFVSIIASVSAIDGSRMEKNLGNLSWACLWWVKAIIHLQ